MGKHILKQQGSQRRITKEVRKYLEMKMKSQHTKTYGM